MIFPAFRNGRVKALPCFYGAFFVLWLLFLGFSEAGTDEVEHTHVAWLIGIKEQIPQKDFFQHHQPVLWDILKLYYFLGGEGPEVLYWGRFLVLCAAIATIWGLHRFERPEQDFTLCSALTGSAFFVFATIILGSVFEIRPDTLCIPLAVWASVLWFARPRCVRLPRQLSDAISGALFGMAVFCSPRFALMSGVFLLPLIEKNVSWPVAIRRLTTFVSGSVLVIVIYMTFSPVTWRNLWFNLIFSARLYQALERLPWYFYIDEIITGIITATTAFMLYRRDWSNPVYRRTEIGCVALTLLGAIILANGFSNNQNLSPGITLIALIFVRIQRRIKAEFPRAAHPVIGGLLGLLLVVFGVYLNDEFTSGKTIFRDIQDRKYLLHRLKPGDRVLLSFDRHPISVENASYYATFTSYRAVFVDADPLCRVVRTMAPSWRLPPCDSYRDILTYRPKMIGTEIESLPDPEYLKRIMRILEQDYTRKGNYYLRKPDQEVWKNGVSMLNVNRFQNSIERQNQTSSPSTDHGNTGSSRCYSASPERRRPG